MIIHNDYVKYLSGESIHTGLDFPISPPGKYEERLLKSRFTLLEELCAGKTVLHVGCADHIDLIDIKRSSGTWLHDRINAVSSRCLGIDVNEEAIAYIRDILCIPNVAWADISNEIPSTLLTNEPWEKVVMGEIIEHVNNPVSFLCALKSGLHGHAKELVLTAPNAMRWENLKKLRQGIECINSDHRFWFTPYTLAKIVFEAGFKPTDFCFVTSYPYSKPSGIRSYLDYRRLLRFPAYRDTIVLRADF